MVPGECPNGICANVGHGEADVRARWDAVVEGHVLHLL